ncbi:unnamed protein product, partial [Didymodactylos carnosus]
MSIFRKEPVLPINSVRKEISKKTTSSYSDTINSVPETLLRLIEGVTTLGIITHLEISKYSTEKMSTRHSNQENSSAFESTRSRHKDPVVAASPSHSDQASKACCFCWCCCCSCS